MDQQLNKRSLSNDYATQAKSAIAPISPKFTVIKFLFRNQNSILVQNNLPTQFRMTSIEQETHLFDVNPKEIFEHDFQN